MSDYNFTTQQLATMSRLLTNLNEANANPLLRMRIYDIKMYGGYNDELYLSYFNEYPADDHMGVELFLIKIDTVGNSEIMNEKMEEFQLKDFISNLKPVNL